MGGLENLRKKKKKYSCIIQTNYRYLISIRKYLLSKQLTTKNYKIMEEKKEIFNNVFVELGKSIIKMVSIVAIAKIGINYLDGLKYKEEG